MDFENPTTENKEAPKQEEPKEKPALKAENKNYSPLEEAWIQKLHAKRYADRMLNRSLDKEVDAMLETEGLKSFTPEAEKFMKKKDREWAEKEFERRNENIKTLLRISSLITTLSGHEDSGNSAKENIFINLGNTVEEISKKEKITEDNLGSAVRQVIEGLSPEHFPWLAKFKEGKDDALENFIKDIVESVKIENQDKFVKRSAELVKKYKIRGNISEEVNNLLKIGQEETQKAKSGEAVTVDKAKIEAFKGQAKSLNEKIFASFGFLGGLIMATIVLSIVVAYTLFEQTLKMKKGK